MADDSYGMGIPLPADSTPIWQFPAVARKMGNRMAEILAGTLPAGLLESLQKAADEVIAGRSLVDSTDLRLGKAADQAWAAAFRNGTVAELREWFRENTGPRRPIDYENPLRGLITVSTQEQANALRGKLIIGSVQLTQPLLELDEFVVRGTPELPFLINYKNTGLPSFSPVNRVYIHHVELDGQHIPETFGIDGPSYASAPGKGIVTEFCHFHGLGEGMRAAGGSVSRYNWIHDMFGWDELTRGPYNSAIHPHSDAMQVTSGSHILIARNFIEHLAIGPNKVACIEINPKSLAVDNVMVRENYMAGGSWTMNIRDDVKGRPEVEVHDNRFGGGFIHNVINIDGDFPAGKYTGNVWADDGKPVPLVPRLGTIPRRAPLLEEDPGQLGYAATYLGPLAGPVTLPAANAARFLRVLSHADIRYIAVQVAVSAGNICVGVYRPTGTGLNAGPGELVATSRSVPCPAAGFRSITLNKLIDVHPGDYLAISADNTMAAFHGITSTASRLTGYQYAGAADAHPLPQNPVVSAAERIPVLAGHA